MMALYSKQAGYFNAPMLKKLFHPKTFLILLCGLVVFGVLFVVFSLVTPEPARVSSPISLDYGPEDPRFGRDLSFHLSAPLVEGNALRLLRNGDEIYPPQLEAMRQARHHIHIETYQFHEGDLTREILDVLKERLAAGVEVRLILDFAGSAKADFGALRDLEDQGAVVVRWRKPRWYQLARLNHRTHRKLTIIDGRLGFIGGANLTDNWLGQPESGGYRDNHFEVTGPIVNHLQRAFMGNLVASTGVPLFGEAYFPELEPTGQSMAQVVLSTPSDGRHRIRKLKLMALASARSNIRLATAYFYPDGDFIQALLDARERGVAVDILLPGEEIDKAFLRLAAQSHWEEMLEAGVRFHEYQPSMFHSKLTIIDREFVSLGSANLDNRSFRINDEANLNVFDPVFAEQLIAIFEQDLASTRAYDLDRWHERSRVDRLRGWLGRTLGAHL